MSRKSKRRREGVVLFSRSSRAADGGLVKVDRPDWGDFVVAGQLLDQNGQYVPGGTPSWGAALSTGPIYLDSPDHKSIVLVESPRAPSVSISSPSPSFFEVLEVEGSVSLFGSTGGGNFISSIAVAMYIANEQVGGGGYTDRDPLSPDEAARADYLALEGSVQLLSDPTASDDLVPTPVVQIKVRLPHPVVITTGQALLWTISHFIIGSGPGAYFLPTVRSRVVYSA